MKPDAPSNTAPKATAGARSTTTSLVSRPSARVDFEPRSLKVVTESKLDQIPQLNALAKEQLFAMRVVSQVLPFRVNQYVIDELIDWS